MSYSLSMSGVLVGRSELEVRDADRKVARGTFRPGLGYELAQPVFDLFEGSRGDSSALERYRQARDALRLQFTDAGGAVIPVRELTIRRKPGAPGGAAEYVIEIEIDHAEFWRAGS